MDQTGGTIKRHRDMMPQAVVHQTPMLRPSFWENGTFLIDDHKITRGCGHCRGEAPNGDTFGLPWLAYWMAG